MFIGSGSLKIKLDHSSRASALSTQLIGFILDSTGKMAYLPAHHKQSATPLYNLFDLTTNHVFTSMNAYVRSYIIWRLCGGAIT